MSGKTQHLLVEISPHPAGEADLVQNIAVYRNKQRADTEAFKKNKFYKSAGKTTYCVVEEVPCGD